MGFWEFVGAIAFVKYAIPFGILLVFGLVGAIGSLFERD